MEFLIHWLAATPAYAAPLLLACLGLIINERAGVLNLGAEGMMACGALAGAAVSLGSGWPMLGLVASAMAGALMAMLFAVVTVYLRANQVITGLVIVALGAGITGVLGRDYVSQTLPGFKPIHINGLSDLSIIGPILFSQNLLTYIAFLAVPLVWYLIFRSMTGLRLRAVGEDPATADACGYNVLLTRFLAVSAGGAFCGLAGGYLTLASSYIWVDGMIAGRGWIAIGLVIFSRWQPKIAVLGALLFGAIEALVPRIQATGADLPIYTLMMLPYLATLAVLVIAGMSSWTCSDEPGSLGTPYNRQDRH